MIPKIHMTRGDDEESLRFFCSMDRDHDKILTFLAHKIFLLGFWWLGAGVWAGLDCFTLAEMVNGMLLGAGVSDHYHSSSLLSIHGLCSLASWLVASLLGGLLGGIGRIWWSIAGYGYSCW